MSCYPIYISKYLSFLVMTRITMAVESNPIVIESLFETLRKFEGYRYSKLGKSRFLSWNVAPFLNNRFLTFLGFVLDLVQTSLGTSTHSSVGVNLGTSLVTCLQVRCGSREHCSLGASWTTVWVLSKHSSEPSLKPQPAGAHSSLGSLVQPVTGVYFFTLFLATEHLLGPLGALGVGGVARGLVLALLLHLSLALHHVILHVVHLLLGPALRLVLGSADLRPLDVTVLDQRGSADLDSLVEGNLLVLDEAALPEVLLALLLLLGLKVGDVGGVAPLVVGVVALDHIIVLSLLHHLHLVNALLAVSPRASSSNISKADTLPLSSLPGCPAVQRLTHASMGLMVGVVVLSLALVEGEGAHQGSRVPGGPLPLASQLPGAKSSASNSQKENRNHLDACHGVS